MKSLRNNTNKVKGFSLVELLVVVAVIGVLLSVVIVSFSSTQARTRDAKRLSDMREIQKALELYFTNHVIYPVASVETILTGNDSVSVILEEENVITNLPSDPIHPTYVYTHTSDADGTDYTLSFCLETDLAFNYSEGCGNIITS